MFNLILFQQLPFFILGHEILVVKFQYLNGIKTFTAIIYHGDNHACIVRESNPGRPRDRRAFYHQTNDAPPTVLINHRYYSLNTQKSLVRYTILALYDSSRHSSGGKSTNLVKQGSLAQISLMADFDFYQQFSITMYPTKGIFPRQLSWQSGGLQNLRQISLGRWFESGSREILFQVNFLLKQGNQNIIVGIKVCNPS